MKICLSRNGEAVEIEADDDLLDSNPYYRSSFEKQVKLITEQFYGAPAIAKEAP